MRSNLALLLATLAASTTLTACRDTTSISAPMESVVAVHAKGGAPKFWDVGASTYWQDRATTLSKTTPISAVRLYTYLSLAQYRAAKAPATIHPHPPTTAAIGGASVVIMKQFFPASAALLEENLEEQMSAAPWPGSKHEDAAAGEAIGRAVALQVLAFAATDGIGVTPLGVRPSGAQYWVPDERPPARGSFQARPLFLASQTEFLPPPPPAFNSPEFASALNEVIQIAATRTQEQIDIANFWNVNQAPGSNAALSDVAVALIRSNRVKDAKAAEIFFRMYAAQYDAVIVCFNAKYLYWLVRPAQAAAIPTVFRTPPHPSYPSAHSCVSGAVTGVLKAAFPAEAKRLDAMATEASLSRLYAGIHYRFDMDAGLALGRNVAKKVLATDLSTLSLTP